VWWAVESLRTVIDDGSHASFFNKPTGGDREDKERKE